MSKIESVQYKTDLPITNVTQGTSQGKLWDKLGLETLKSQRWLRRICCLYKIINPGIHKYLPDLILKCEIAYNISDGHNPFLVAELKDLKIHFSHILLRLGIV